MRVTLTRPAGLAAGLFAVTLSAAALATAVLAGPAAAGGPTSALLSVPGTGTTASLYYTDAEYDELAGLVGVAEPSGTFGGEESAAGHASGTGVTVTWLIHDVDPWRVDRIYLDGKDGPWVATQVADFEGSIWDSPVLWHQPPDSARLADLLDAVGMGTGGSPGTASDSDGNGNGDDRGAGAIDTTSEEGTSPAAVSDPTGTSESGWRTQAGWAVGGLAGGALLTLAWTRRRQLDGRADDVGVTGASGAPGGSEQYTEVLAR